MPVGSLSERFALLITADPDDAVKGLKRVGDTAEKELGKTQDHLDKVGGRMQVAGAGMIAFGAVALVGLGHMAGAAEDAERASLKLQNSIANSPQMAGETSQAFDDLADSLMKTTVVDDEATRSAEALLIQFGLTKAQVLELTPLVIDLSRKLGVDMDTAAKMVGKSVEGSAGALKKAGIVVDETAFKTDAYGATVDALRHSVGGFAEEEGKTFAGQLQILQNQFGELEEGVGVGVVDAFSTMFGAVSTSLGALDSLAPGTQSAIGQLATYGATAVVVGGGLSMLAGTFIKARGAVDTLGQGIGLSGSALAGFRQAIGATAIAVTGAAAAWAIWQGRMAQGDEAVSKFATGVKSKFTAASGSLDQWNATLATVPAAIKDLNDTANSSSAPWDADYRSDLRKGADALEEIQQKYTAVSQRAEELARTQGMSRDAALQAALSEAGLKEQTAALDPEMAALTQTQGGLTDQTNDLAAALKGLHDTEHALMDPLFGLTKAEADNATAQASAGAAVMLHQEALNQLDDATRRYGAGSDEANAAAMKVLDTQNKLDGAYMAVAQSAMSVNDAAQTLSGAMASGAVTTEGMKDQLGAWVQQGLLTAQQAQEVADKLGIVIGQANALDGRTINLGVKIGTTYVGNNPGASAVVKIGASAAGQTNWPGGLSWVGEKGPELVELPSGSNVYPSDVSAQMSSPFAAGGALQRAGGSGAVLHVENHFHIATVIGEEQAVLDVFERAGQQGFRAGPGARRLLGIDN